MKFLKNLYQGDKLILNADVTLHAWIYHKESKGFISGYVLVKYGTIFDVKVNWELVALDHEAPLVFSLCKSEYKRSDLIPFDGKEGVLVDDLTAADLTSLISNFTPAPRLSTL